MASASREHEEFSSALGEFVVAFSQTDLKSLKREIEKFCKVQDKHIKIS